jgi:AcrR family transcriptional regulator
MKTLTPKKQEIAQRESRILAVARPMVVRDGYHGLNMDRIACELGLSKGTIYNHFSCKEEIVIALLVETVTKRMQMFRQAAQFQECSRFRMMSIGEAAERFARQWPEHFRFEQIVRLDSVWEKTSEKRRDIVRSGEMNCMGTVAGIVRDAIASGELHLPRQISPEDLVFGLWSLTSGAYSIVLTSDSLENLGMNEPYATVRTHTSVMLDGYAWQPLSHAFDRDEILTRIGKEVFGDA